MRRYTVSCSKCRHGEYSLVARGDRDGMWVKHEDIDQTDMLARLERIEKKIDSFLKSRELSRIVSKCYCCGIHRTLEEFRCLPLKGHTDISDISDAGHTTAPGEIAILEQRDCPCRSTLSIWLDSNRNYVDDSDWEL